MCVCVCVFTRVQLYVYYAERILVSEFRMASLGSAADLETPNHTSRTVVFHKGLCSNSGLFRWLACCISEQNIVNYCEVLILANSYLK